MRDIHSEHIPLSRRPSDKPGEVTSSPSPLEFLIGGLERFAYSLEGYRPGDNIVYEPPAPVTASGSEVGYTQTGNSFTVNLGTPSDPDRVIFIEATSGTGKEMGTLPFGEGEAAHWRIGGNGVAVLDKAELGKPGVEPGLWLQEQLAAFKERADDPSQRSFFRVEQTVGAKITS